MKNKIIYLGEIESINLELISKSFFFLKDKVRYIVVANIKIISESNEIINNYIKINEILDPINFTDYKINCLNVYNIDIGSTKFSQMINQINFCNKICKLKKYDLITMPIDKYLFKKNIANFNGMTEYLGYINNANTSMLMVGENFSIIPITTHLRMKGLFDSFYLQLDRFIKKLNYLQKNNKLKIYNKIIFLCINPHCGENGLVGDEEIYLAKSLKKINFKKIELMPADSAFRTYNKKYLYISYYHDQALIPFKILNKNSFNYTLGLPYRRLSPSHGTAKDIKFKNLADNTSYLKCMLN